LRAARFVEGRAAAWDRLEKLVSKARTRLGRLSDDELHELTRLYPAVAVDVARARTYGVAPTTQRRLNQVAIAAHGLLYRRPRPRYLRAIGAFLGGGYPRLFRRLWVYAALSFSVALVCGLGAYVSTRLQPANAYLLVPGCAMPPESGERTTAQEVEERFRALPKAPMAAAILSNNVSVAFQAFALGITAGIGTGYVLLFNSVMLGALAAHYENHRAAYAFWSFILPHGVLEILAILIAGAAGMRLGLSLVVPRGLSRRSSLRAGAREAMLLVLGTVPMFAVAGVIEGFVTPSYLPGGVKIAVGVAAGCGALAYLLLVGRGRAGQAPVVVA